EKSLASEPYLNLSKKEFASQLTMPKRTLDKILNEIREENKVFYKVTRGRNGGMIIASVKTLFARAIQLSKEKRLYYSTRITELFLCNLRVIYLILLLLSSNSYTILDVDLSEVSSS